MSFCPSKTLKRSITEVEEQRNRAIVELAGMSPTEPASLEGSHSYSQPMLTPCSVEGEIMTPIIVVIYDVFAESIVGPEDALVGSNFQNENFVR